MDASEPYDLGIDCYPLGKYAVVHTDNKLFHFELLHDNQPIYSYKQRIHKAILLAENKMGVLPKNIGICLVDDGGDGHELMELVEELACQIVTLCESNNDLSPEKQSIWRAKQAATTRMQFT